MQILLTPKTLGAMLGLAEQTIYNRHSNRGDLPPVLKVGRLLRFRPSDVDAWLASKEEPTAPTTTPISSPPRRPGRPTKAEQVAARCH